MSKLSAFVGLALAVSACHAEPRAETVVEYFEDVKAEQKDEVSFEVEGDDVIIRVPSFEGFELREVGPNGEKRDFKMVEDGFGGGADKRELEACYKSKCKKVKHQKGKHYKLKTHHKKSKKEYYYPVPISVPTVEVLTPVAVPTRTFISAVPTRTVIPANHAVAEPVAVVSTPVKQVANIPSIAQTVVAAPRFASYPATRYSVPSTAAAPVTTAFRASMSAPAAITRSKTSVVAAPVAPVIAQPVVAEPVLLTQRAQKKGKGKGKASSAAPIPSAAAVQMELVPAVTVARMRGTFDNTNLLQRLMAYPQVEVSAAPSKKGL